VNLKQLPSKLLLQYTWHTCQQCPHWCGAFLLLLRLPDHADLLISDVLYMKGWAPAPASLFKGHTTYTSASFACQTIRLQAHNVSELWTIHAAVPNRLDCDPACACAHCFTSCIVGRMGCVPGATVLQTKRVHFRKFWFQLLNPLFHTQIIIKASNSFGKVFSKFVFLHI